MNNNNSSESSFFTERVVQGPDRVYRVIYGMIVGLPALIGALVLNSDTRSYEMDDECIRHKHATRGGDAVVIFRNVTWADEEENAIRMKEGITTYTMYAPPEDATFVKEYIRNRIGSEKYKS